MALKQKDGSYAVVFSGSIFTPQKLKEIGEKLDEHGVNLIKFSESQRLVVVGINPDKLGELCRETGMEIAPAVGRVVRGVRFCPAELCPLGLQKAIEMGERLKKFEGLEMPDKLKIAISGCPNSCTEPVVRDIGLMGTKDGWTIFVGGSAGRRPRIGWKLFEKVNTEDSVKIVEKIVEYYKKNAQKGQRLGDFIESIGFENFRRDIQYDLEN